MIKLLQRFCRIHAPAEVRDRYRYTLLTARLQKDRLCNVYRLRHRHWHTVHSHGRPYRTWERGKRWFFFILNVIVIVFQKQLTRNAKERVISSCLRYLPLCSIAITQLFANWRRWWDKLLNIEKKKRFRRAKCIWTQAKFLFLSFSVSFLVCRCSAPRCYADVIACPCWVSPKRRSSPSNQVRRGFESTPGYSV